MISGDPLALLLTLIPPVTLPGAVGANLTFRVTVADGASISGNVMPLAEIPAPVAVMVVI